MGAVEGSAGWVAIPSLLGDQGNDEDIVRDSEARSGCQPRHQHHGELGFTGLPATKYRALVFSTVANCLPRETFAWEGSRSPV
jgi:hypothetical protein